jgi:hypothetical protein
VFIAVEINTLLVDNLDVPMNISFKLREYQICRQWDLQRLDLVRLIITEDYKVKLAPSISATEVVAAVIALSLGNISIPAFER